MRPPRPLSLAWSAFSAMLLWAVTPAAAGPAGDGIVEYTLPNGLHVLLKESHTSPIVSVWCWYSVGSKDERPGITGITHWVEHMNFKGTQGISKEDMKGLIERYGGAWNGYTWLDETTYFETLSSEALDVALRLESERMAKSLFDPEEVKVERSVVISELQGGENNPEELLDIEVTATAFKAHPYQWPTIGWLSDLQAITREDLYQYYRAYYTPNNATLVVVGDFDPATIQEKIEAAFGGIPRGPEVTHIRTVEPPQSGERRVVLKREGTTQYLRIAFHAPPVDSADAYPLLVLDTILAGVEGINLWELEWSENAGKSSRLYRGLVDKGLASNVGILYLLTQDPFLFYFYATIREGAKIEDAEAAILAEIERIQSEPIPEREFEKALNQLRARFVYDSDSVTDQAHQLGYFATISRYEVFTGFLDRLAGVTPEDVQRVARKYLTESNRTVGWFLPQGEGAESSEGMGASGGAGERAGSMGGASARALKAYRAQVAGGSSAAAPAPVRKVLANGLTVVVQENPISPEVAVRAFARAGSVFDGPEKQGLANFVALLLDRGTATRSLSALAEELDFVGARLQAGASRHTLGMSAQMLAGDFRKVLGLVADVLRNPAFPAEEVEKARGEILTGIAERRDDTQAVAEDAFRALVYPPDHPYHWPVQGTEETVRRITREDLVSFHRRHVRPDLTTVLVVGDVPSAEALAAVEEALGDWQATGDAPAYRIPEAGLPKAEQDSIVPMMNKTQADIALGQVGVPRTHPDYYAVEVMNTILGQFGLGGRLGENIRDEQGLAYYVYSSYDAGIGAGPFLVRAGVNPANVEKAVASIRAELRRIREGGVTEEELAESKRYLIGSLPRRMETNEGITGILEGAELYGLGLDFPKRYPSLIEAVTLEAVRKAAREHIRPDRTTLVVAGPYTGRVP